MFVSKLIENCWQSGTQLSLFSKNGDQYTWTDYLMNVIKVATSLKSLGISEKDTIIIQGNNSPKWFWVAMAAMYLGCILIPIPNRDLDSKYLKKFIKQNKVSFIFCDCLKTWEDLKNKYIIKLVTKIEPEDQPKVASQRILTWDNFLNMGGENYIKPKKTTPKDIAWRLIKESDLKQENFKLVSVTYQQLESVVSIYQANYGIMGGKMISYLPLHQINVLVFDFLFSLEAQTIIYFCNPQTKEQIPMLLKELETVKPVLFYSVPYIWNQLKEHYSQQLESIQHFLIIRVLGKFIQYINYKFHCHLYQQQRNTVMFYILIGLYYISKWIFGYFKQKIGFQKCQIFINIYEHLKIETLQFFCGIDIPIFQVYGNLETTGLISLSNSYSDDNVGFPVMQMSITDENQILVKGNTLNDSLRDSQGWYYTQDCGKLLENGQLQLFGSENSQGNQLTKIEFYFKNNIKYLQSINIKKTRQLEGFIDIFLLLEESENQQQDISIWINKFNNNWKQYQYQINDFKIINFSDTNNENCRDSLGKLYKNWSSQFK